MTYIEGVVTDYYFLLIEHEEGLMKFNNLEFKIKIQLT